MPVKGIAKVALGLMLLVAVFGGGYTVALFTAVTGQTSNNFVAGTVRLGTPATNVVDITNMAPGAQDTLSYEVTYTGSLDAWIGLDTSLAGDLVTCDGGGRLAVTISDGSKTYSANGLDQVVARVSNGTTMNFSIHYQLALQTANPCQEKSAAFGIRVKAVQASDNTKSDNSGPIMWNDGSALDQSSGALTVDTQGADQVPWAQTFTAGRTGLLDRVELYVHGPADLDATVTIRTVDGSGQPTDTILASATLLAADIPAGDNLIAVPFALPAPVVAGTMYAIYRTPLTATGWSWNQPIQNSTYSGGEAWADRRADLGFWEEYSAYDLPFRTYVQ